MTATVRLARLVADHHHDITAAARNARDVVGSVGYPTGTSGPRRSSDVSDPTGTAAVAAVDDQRPSDYGLAQRHLAAIAAFERAAAELLATMRPMLATRVRELTLPGGMGNCAACNLACWNRTGSDRLKSGLCPGCYTAWTRHQRMMHDANLSADRTVWVAARRTEHTDSGPRWLDDEVDVAQAYGTHRQPQPAGASQAIGTMAHIHQRLGEGEP